MAGLLPFLPLLLLPALLLPGCASRDKSADDDIPPRIARIPDAVPRVEPRSRLGNPDTYVVAGQRYAVLPDSRGYRERGLASWYGEPFHGRRTSSGETYDMHAMSAAHKTLPLPTYARVTNLDNGRSVVIRINDRGPFHDDRVIDLSHTAAVKLGVVRTGTARVEVRALDPRRPRADPGPVLAAAPPPARPAIASGAPLYLQVGAFGDPGNAERLRARLADRLGHPVRIQDAVAGGATLYRVRVGPLDSDREAEDLSARLAALGIDRARMVRN